MLVSFVFKVRASLGLKPSLIHRITDLNEDATKLKSFQGKMKNPNF